MMKTNNPLQGPVLFVGHGNPMNAIGENIARPAWKEMGQSLEKPKAIIAVSSHWVTQGVKVRVAKGNPKINDMYGFPPELYAVDYAPASDSALAHRVAEVLDAEADNSWGIDHGVWAVLTNMYPEADVPVVMVSVDATASPQQQFEVGQKLAAFRKEGVMILASGNVVHNLRRVNWQMAGGFDWADAFDEFIRQSIERKDFEAVIHFREHPHADLAVPTTEHFYPILTALGASTSQDEVKTWNAYRELGSMSMTSYLFA